MIGSLLIPLLLLRSFSTFAYSPTKFVVSSSSLKKPYINKISITGNLPPLQKLTSTQTITLPLSPYFTTLTGETGAGKSVLIDLGVKGFNGECLNSYFEDPLSVSSTYFVDIAIDVKNSEDIQTITRRITSNSDTCEINARSTSLPQLSKLTKGLISRVTTDCTTRKFTVSERLNVIDRVSAPHFLLDENPEAETSVRTLGQSWSTARKERLKLEKQIAKINSYSDDTVAKVDDKKLMETWVDELDKLFKDFSAIVGKFMKLAESSNFPSILDNKRETFRQTQSYLLHSNEGRVPISMLQWLRTEQTGLDITVTDNSELQHDDYDFLLNLESNYENLKQDLQISLELRETCQNGLYASLLDARKLLLQLGEDEAEASTTEAVHDKLNSLEASIKSMLGDNMINKIINEYESDIVDFERACGTGGGLEEIVSQWTTFARKHSVLPHNLPVVFMDLVVKLGSGELLIKKLNVLKKVEKKAFGEFKAACEVLTQLRKEKGEILGKLVTAKMEGLGFAKGIAFLVKVEKKKGAKTKGKGESLEEEVYLSALGENNNGNGDVGIDSANFVIVNNNTNAEASEQEEEKIVGELDKIASSGERSRILLILESVVPGAIGLTKSKGNGNGKKISPILTIYDEIDAHIGGRASTKCAEMMSSQSHLSQCLSITHSGVVASYSNVHLVVEPNSNGGVESLVDDESRVAEIVRMISGENDEGKMEGLEFARRLREEGRAYIESL